MSTQPVRTEPAPNCLLCKGSGTPFRGDLRDRLYSVPGSWNFYRCGGCGLLWLNPRPMTEDLARCYPDGYFTHTAVTPILGSSGFRTRVRMAALRSGLGYERLPASTWHLSLLGRMALLTPFVREKIKMGLGEALLPYRQGGRLLDIGCGSGSYLALMKTLGWEVAGVEVDAKAAEIARSRFQLFVHTGSLEDAPFAEESFDAATISHVLEHIPDPAVFIRGVARFLRPRGQLVIVTPNAQSLGHRILRENWYPLQPPQHLVLFTPKSLEMCLDEAGCFRQVKIATSARLSRKVWRKFILAKKTDRFRHDFESALSRAWQTRASSRLFQLVEVLGNPIFRWGEEIECIAVKA